MGLAGVALVRERRSPGRRLAHVPGRAGAGTFNWTGGAIAATLSLPLTFSFNLSGSNDKTLGFANVGIGVLTSAGPVTWTGAGNLNAYGSSAWTNGGTFTVQNDAQVINYAGSSVFVNTGTLRKNTTTGATVFASDNGG